MCACVCTCRCACVCALTRVCVCALMCVCAFMRVCAVMFVYGVRLVIKAKGVSPEIQALDRILLRGLENSPPLSAADGGGGGGGGGGWVKGHPGPLRAVQTGRPFVSESCRLRPPP